jgi:hypothetical protein
MTSIPPISTAPFEYSAMDFGFLRQEGINYIARLGGQLWTDYNVHDPGITILEQVCYAITDLARRINYEIPDLLTRAGEETFDSLYGPAEVLPSRPVTLNDLRRLVIDVPGVKNAWIEPVETTLYYDSNQKTLQVLPPQDQNLARAAGAFSDIESINLKGLYRVLVELSDLQYTGEIRGIPQPAALLAQAAQRLYANRALGEDFEYPVELNPQMVQVTANIEIGPVDDAENLLVAIYQRMADYISPSIPFYSLQQMLDAGRSIDQILEGPLLEHGFIDSRDLAKPRRTALRVSDLISTIMDVPGVRAVKMIKISVDNSSPQAWSIDLDPQKAPKLDLDKSNIQLEKDLIAVSGVINNRAKNNYLNQLRASAFDPANLKFVGPATLAGRDRQVENYYSIQHQFPAIYGIGVAGLPESAPAERHVQAKQLKAYLLFFDQLLANYFSQLANVKDLFSFSPKTPVTYFSQPIDDPTLDLSDIFNPDYRDALAKLAEPGPDSQAQRRNRFLNHLLARFAEEFTDYSLVLYSALPTGDTAHAEKLIEDKQALLKDYPQISSGRATAINYTLPWSSANSSGLEKRLRRILGLDEQEGNYFYMVEHILLRPMIGDEVQQIPLLTDTQSKDPYSLQLSFIFPADPARFQNPAFRDFIERTIREETPAHLVVYFHWFGQEMMAAFKTAYNEWLDTRRAYLTGA